MKAIIANTILSLALAAGTQTFAQSNEIEAKSVATAAPAANKCFTSPKSSPFLRICLTDHGTIFSLETTANGSIINHIFGREGYAVCSNAGSSTIGFDAEITEQGWSTPVVTQPKGSNKLPFIVTRSSTDGTVQLQQTFNLNAPRREVSIKMDLKNISGSAVPFPVFARYFDGDIDASPGDDLYELTLDSVAARNAILDPGPGIGHGLTLTTDLHDGHRPEAESFGVWNPIGGQGQTARTCFGQEPAIPTAGPSDQIGRLISSPPGTEIKPGQTVTSTFLYRVF